MCVRVVEQNLTVLHGNLTSRLLGGRGEGTQFSHASVSETAAASAFVITYTYVVSCCWLVDAKIQSDYLRITVQTVCLKDLVKETYLICCSLNNACILQDCSSNINMAKSKCWEFQTCKLNKFTRVKSGTKVHKVHFL